MIKIIKSIILMFSIIITGCSTNYHKTLISSYSHEKSNFQDVGYNKGPWLINPIIFIDDQIAVKIHSSSWSSLSSSHKFCTKDFSEFTFMFWTKENVEFDLYNTFFSNNLGQKISINSVKKINSKELVYEAKKNFSTKMNLQKSDFEFPVLSSLWLAGNIKKMKYGENFISIKTDSFVGCSGDNYKLTMLFNVLNSNKSLKKVLYFYPVAYESISR